MISSYKDLFTIKGTKLFCVAGFIARLPVAMIGIGIITMLSQIYGNYWLAGTVAGTYTLSTALIGPQISKLVDRYGQFRILRIASFISIFSIFALLLSIHFKAPTWVFYIWVVMAGCLPNISAMVRSRWSSILHGTTKLHTAFSLESVIDELCFIIGPPLSVGLSILLFPEAGVLIGAILFIIGVTTFILQRKTEPKVIERAKEQQKWVLGYVSIRTILLVLISIGVIVGVIDVVSVAFAKEQHIPMGASLILSLYAISSCFSGLLFGSTKFRLPLSLLFLMSTIATAITAIPLPFTYNILTLSIVVFIAGFFFSPTMILAMQLIEKQLPSSQLTEGLTWAGSSLACGVALGAALAGWIVDEWSTRHGFSIAICAGVIIVLATTLGYRHLKNSDSV